MKLKDLKKFVNKLSKEDLEKELIYNSRNNCLSGVVSKIYKQRGNLYYDGSDDPAELFTMKQLKEEGMDKEEIESMIIEVPHLSVVIEF